MRLILRTVLTLAAVGVVTWGFTEQRHWPDWRWLLCLGVAGLLLALAWWPSFRRRTPIFNRTVIRLATLVIIAVLIVTVQLVRIQIVESSRTMDRVVMTEENDVVQNPRLHLAEQHERGRILASDGSVLAESRVNDDGTVSRVYLEPSTMSLIGYYAPSLYGASGIESSQDRFLSGGDGGNPLTEWLDGVLHRTRPGYDVELTLDLELQRLARDLLAGYQGAAVLMDAETGEILALADTSDLDTNRLSSANLEDARLYWSEVVEREDGPLVFRPTQGLYTPGSTFKTVVAAAAIDAGIALPESGYRDEGVLEVDGRVIIEPNRPDESRVAWSLEESYAYSLNVVFAQLGLQVGADGLGAFTDQLGFGSSISFDLSVEPSQLHNEESSLASRALLADTGYGQGEVLVTPLQMALIVAAIENGGSIPEPFVVGRVLDRDGKVLEEQDPDDWRDLMNASTASAMRELMLASAEYGYASGARIEGLTIGGKTGTAETGSGEPHAWFIGFVETGEHNYVVSVVVEHGGRGGDTALPIGRSLLAAAAQ